MPIQLEGPDRCTRQLVTLPPGRTAHDSTWTENTANPGQRSRGARNQEQDERENRGIGDRLADAELRQVHGGERCPCPARPRFGQHTRCPVHPDHARLGRRRVKGRKHRAGAGAQIQHH